MGSFVCPSFRIHNKWVLCVFCKRNSSYRFPIFVKLCRCIAYDLKVCMWFVQYCTNYYFSFCELVNSHVVYSFDISVVMSGYFVSTAAPTVLFRSL